MRKQFLAMLASVACVCAAAQQSPISVNVQRLTSLPGEISSLSVVDGELYCHSSGVLLKACRKGEQIASFHPDTLFARHDEGVEYVVRHPASGELYFTRRNAKGQSYLYMVGENGKCRQVVMGEGGWFSKGMTVEHPTFTSDGKIMVFSSDTPQKSRGGYDLWYARYDGKGWRNPHNLGTRINTKADETCPTMYRDYLLFSSNGHSGDLKTTKVYSSRLLSSQVEGDTVGMLQIGRSRVQEMPAPINEGSRNYAFVSDPRSGIGYWVSSREKILGNDQICSFSGLLDAVLFWGIVSDPDGHVVQGVNVTVQEDGKTVCSTVTDSDGFYRFYLQCGRTYQAIYQLENYFVSLETIATQEAGGEALVSETRKDVILDRLPKGERIYLDNLFGPNSDVELSAYGKEKLAPVVRFLRGNPSAQIQMSLTCDLTADRDFNRLLTESRIKTLHEYLGKLIPSTVRMSIFNGCASASGCSNATGASRLMLMIE